MLVTRLRALMRIGPRLKDPPTPQTSLSTQTVNTRGLPALPDEIYLEIISHIRSVPIPTPPGYLYGEICRFRHKTLKSLSQTCRSLRRFFWRYLWQRIEARPGMKIGHGYDTLEEVDIPHIPNRKGLRKALKKYTKVLLRQLEIVTVHNPQLAQYVNYLDILIGEYSLDAVLAKLARCLSLFPNLHTVQIDVRAPRQHIFEQTFKNYSYPQIRNVFVAPASQSFIASCPEARRVGHTGRQRLPQSCLYIMIANCPRLEVLENFEEFFWRADTCSLIVDSFPNLRTITVSPLLNIERPSHINILQKLNYLQTIILSWDDFSIGCLCYLRWGQEHAHLERMKEYWIGTFKDLLLQLQLRDNLEKTLVIRDPLKKGERIISIELVEKDGLKGPRAM